MGHYRSLGILIALAILIAIFGPVAAFEGDRTLSLSWDKEMLTIRGQHLPGGAVAVWYIEAYCRPGSTSRDWKRTVIPHKTELVEADRDGRRIKLRSRLDDGVVVDHEIRAGRDEVDFRLVATNPTAVESHAQWAQPCIRVDRFTGTKAERSSEDYLPRCFIYVDGKPVRMPTAPWARSALYTPGQVWCPEGVSRDDVNPRPAEHHRPLHRSDRLRLGRRQGVAGDRVGALPGAVPGRHRLPALRLPDRRLEAGRIEGDPRQDLPDAGRFRGAGSSIPHGLPRARPSRHAHQGRRVGEAAHRVRLGRARDGLPAVPSRRARIHALRRLRLPRRRPVRARYARQLHVALLGTSRFTPEELEAPRGPLSRSAKRGSDTISSASI